MSIELKSGLERLQQELDERLRDFERHPPAFGNPELISQAVQQIRKRVSIERETVYRDRIQEALTILDKQGLKNALNSHPRYLCWGLLTERGPSKQCFLHDTKRFPLLLTELERMTVDSTLPLMAWRGLLQAYFGFNPSGDNATGQDNWKALRCLLVKTLPVVIEHARFRPVWLETIQAHDNLLSEQPCDRYGAKVLAGDESEINSLRHELKIPQDSWFWSKLFLTQVKLVTGRDDAGFKADFEPLLKLLQEHVTVRDEALKLLLERYAIAAFRNELHPGLRDFALDAWGTPHLERNARWNLVNPDAKQMVRSWLVVRALDDFFKLLQENRATDRRRLRFWQRYEHSIEYFHFALGPYVYNSRDEDYVTFRKTFGEQICELRHPGNYSNNAFIFEIGDYYFVEFAVTGNALYCYHKDNTPFRLPRSDVLNLNFDLKVPSKSRLRLSHMSDWEDGFESELRKLGISPDWIAKSSQSGRLHGNFSNDPCDIAIVLAQNNNMAYKDERQSGGALWINEPKPPAHIAERLKQLGFKFHPGRGWWRK